jgi:hypothetical protein
VHEVVVREGWVKRGGLTGVGPNHLHADAPYISLLGKKDGSFLANPGVWGPQPLTVSMMAGARFMNQARCAWATIPRTLP